MSLRSILPRKRLAMLFCVLGVVLMGVDLLLTRNIFTHIAELMGASLLCFIIGLTLDRSADRQNSQPHKAD